MLKWLSVLVLFFGLTACASAPAASSTANPSAASTRMSVDVLTQQLSVAQAVAQQLPTAVPPEVISAADAEHLLLANLYERLAPSVVFVEVVIGAEEGFAFNDVGNGSGFIYDLNGHIITNAHVVLDADEVRVTFHNGYVTDAEVIGYDTYSDLAVIKVDVNAERLRPIPLGNSDLTRVGDRAIVIGNPFGLASSMTVGIISAKGRQIPSAELLDTSLPSGFQNPSILQVDADINPGNSGGPLLNSAGEVIGVNTAIRTQSGVFEGVGFSVPASTVRRVVPELIENGSVNYAWIGISAMSAADGFGVASLAEALNLPVTDGVMLSAVTPNSPAAKAGLRGGNALVLVRGREICTGGDIIVSIDGQNVATMDELVTYLVTNSKPGDTVQLGVVRGREVLDVPVTLEERPTVAIEVPNCG